MAKTPNKKQDILEKYLAIAKEKKRYPTMEDMINAGITRETYRHHYVTLENLTLIAQSVNPELFLGIEEGLIKRPKVLVFDIETAPIEALVWSIWDQNIPLSRIKKDWSVLAWAAKWLGEDPKKTIYVDTFKQKDKRDDSKILEKIWEMLDEADFVVGHNSNSFDIKKLNARFVQHDMPPPSSYKKLDTKILCKRHFAFTSNKLEYITDKLCTKYKKLTHKKFPGNALWDEYLAGNKEAQKEMEIYNIYDVLSLEEAFYKILPWESASLFEIYSDSEINVCTCGSIDFVESGFHYTQTAKFQKYKCVSCGAEARDKNNLISKSRKKKLHMKAN